MSDDLISRKDAIAIIENMIFESGRNLSKVYLLQKAKERIGRLASAFDKEKVIEELTDRKNDADNQAAKYDEAGDIVNMDLQDMAARCYANTIEIVEKGGI